MFILGLFQTCVGIAAHLGQHGHSRFRQFRHHPLIEPVIPIAVTAEVQHGTKEHVSAVG